MDLQYYAGVNMALAVRLLFWRKSHMGGFSSFAASSGASTAAGLAIDALKLLGCSFWKALLSRAGRPTTEPATPVVNNVATLLVLEMSYGFIVNHFGIRICCPLASQHSSPK